MSQLRIASMIVGFITLLTYMLGSNYWVKNGGWYRSLQQPSWQPPDWIFGVIWPYNFLIIGIAMYSVISKAPQGQSYLFLVFFIASVACALRWSYLFYGPHALQQAAISLLMTALFTIPMTILVFKHSLVLGFAFLPYQLWLLIAASLSAAYARLN